MESEDEHRPVPSTRSILLYGSIGMIGAFGLAALFALAKSAVDDVFGAGSEGAQMFFWIFSVVFVGSLIAAIGIILVKFWKELFRGK